MNIKKYEVYNEEINIKKSITGAVIGAGIALSSPFVKSQDISKDTNYISREIQKMKSDEKVTINIRIDKDISDFYKYDKFDYLYESPSGMSDDDVLKNITREKIKSKSILKCSGINELIEKYTPITKLNYKTENGRVYFIEEFKFPKEKIEEYKKLIFPNGNTKENEDKWNYLRDKNYVKINFDELMLSDDVGSIFNKKYRDILSNTDFNNCFKNIFFVRKKDVNKCFDIIERFKLTKKLTKNDLNVFYNFGFIDRSQCQFAVERSISGNGIYGVNSYKSDVINYASALVRRIEEVLISLKINGVIQINKDDILNINGDIDNSFIKSDFKSGEYVIDFIKEVKPSKDDILNQGERFISYKDTNGDIILHEEVKSKTILKIKRIGENKFLWLVAHPSFKVDDLEVFGKVTKFIEKDTIASSNVFNYGKEMLNKIISIKDNEVNDFYKKNKGRTTVLSNIGKVKVDNVYFDDKSFSELRKSYENKIFNKLSNKIKDTSEIIDNFKKDIDNFKYVVIIKDNGEKETISMSKFELFDLGKDPLKFGKSLPILINGDVKIGMNKEMIIFAFGNPDDIDRTATKDTYNVIYIYRNREFNRDGDRFSLVHTKYENTYLYFDGDILTSIIDR